MILVDKVPVQFGKFPNGESNLNFNKIQVSNVSTITLKFESDQDLFNLFVLVSWCHELFHVNPGALILEILYMPYSRMDRRNQFYTFNLKYVCNFINALNFRKVIVYDAHSDVTTALLDRCEERSNMSLLLTKMIDEHATNDFSIMYPDAGAQKRYTGLIAANEIVGIKHRNFESGAIDSFELQGKIDGKDVVIIDDLCSKGGTFLMAAERLKKYGSGNVYLLVGHCEETVFTGTLLDTDSPIEKVYTTNSIVWASKGAAKLDITPIYEVKPCKR